MVQEACIYIGRQKFVVFVGIVSMQLTCLDMANLMFVMGNRLLEIMPDI
jgi:hypothetical protein